MKQILLFPLIAFFALSIAFAEDGSWRQSDETLTGILGIKSYVVDAAPPKGKVFVMRQTESINGKVTAINALLAYTAGEKIKLTVVYYDPSTFAFSTPEMKTRNPVMIKAAITGITGATSAWFGWMGPIIATGSSWGSGYTCGPSGVTFSFTDSQNIKTLVQYTSSIEDYDSVKKRIPQLPPILGNVLKWASPYNIPVDK